MTEKSDPREEQSIRSAIVDQAKRERDVLEQSGRKAPSQQDMERQIARDCDHAEKMKGRK